MPAALALLGIFFFSITRRAAPVLSAVTPAAAAAATAPSLTSPSKASAGIPMPPSQGAANSSSPSTPGRQDVNSVASSAGSDPQLSPASARESLPFTSTPSGNPATDLVSPYTLPSGVPSRSSSSSSGRSLPSTRVQVSSGVMAGNLVTSHPPRYPGGVAGLFHTEGKVTMQAVISKSGRVENLHVLSGHYLLRNAARNAVQTWRYRPYYVNGNPVEVATIVSVEFHR